MAKDKLTGIKGSVLVAIALLIIFFVFSKANATELELGPTYLKGKYAEGGMLVVSEQLGDKWAVGGGIVTEQFVRTCHRDNPEHQRGCDWDVRENIFFEVQRVATYKRIKVGLGPAYFQNINRGLGANLNWSIKIGYQFNDKWSIQARHYSNAGSRSPNLGQDAITIGYRF
jgi:hypothetical protein